MKIRRRGPKNALNSTLVLCCLCALSLLVTVVADTEEKEEVTEEAPELLIDNEIDALDDPHRNRNYVFGRVVEALVGFTSKAVHGDVDVSRMLYGGNSSTNLYGDNPLWEGLFRDCGQAKPTLTCVKKSVFNFLDRSIGTDGDVEVTNGLVFTKKRGFEEVFENKYDRRLNEEIEGVTTEENMVVTTDPTMEKDSARSYSSFDELTNTLYDKGEKFIMTHDVELQLPEFIFEGAVLKISPKALQEEGGALLKVELNKKTDTGEGRILFKKHKKKLMMAFFALMMVIKMIKVKLMFLLPLLLGVGTAKKIFLKLLLFIFPAFAHIFKFCAYYHATRAKFHHHHHQIAHHHHHVPVHVPVPVVTTNHNHGPVVIDHPPSSQHPHHSYSSISDSYGPPLNSYGEPTDSYGSPDPPSGGGWDSEFISSRNENLPPTVNELESWGLMSTNGAYHVPPSAQYPLMYDEQRPARNAYEVGVHPQQSPLIQQQQQQLLLMQQQQQKQAQLAMLQQQKVQQQLQPLQHSQGIPPQPQKVMQAVTSGGPTATAALVQAKQRLKQQQQQLAALKMKSLTPRPPIEKVAITVPVTYDPFYSPILQRMDNVFVQLGFNEEACRERLVCSMYKMPERFSPHSNLISAELSRDSRELQKPAVPNSASVRFHRYIQAARDGQNRKDCLKLYPACTVKTE